MSEVSHSVFNPKKILLPMDFSPSSYVALETATVGNDVVGNIMMVIDREQIDMIVISTHGMSGWRPAIFGSIAEKVVKLVQCPLLLLRSVEAIDKP